jgi:hypothetical protein
MFENENELDNEIEVTQQDLVEESSHKRDKIFENTYEETESDSGDFNFKIDPSMETRTYEYTIDEEMIFDKFEDLIKDSKFTKFNTMQEGRTFKKMNKGDINEVYSFVTTSLIGHPKIEIFSVICGYFDISPDKFYESLSNSFKTELITELKGRGFLSSRKSLF